MEFPTRVVCLEGLGDLAIHGGAGKEVGTTTLPGSVLSMILLPLLTKPPISPSRTFAFTGVQGLRLQAFGFGGLGLWAWGKGLGSPKKSVLS